MLIDILAVSLILVLAVALVVFGVYIWRQRIKKDHQYSELEGELLPGEVVETDGPPEGGLK